MAGSACFPESLFEGGSTWLEAWILDEGADGVVATLLAGVAGDGDCFSAWSFSKRCFAALDWSSKTRKNECETKRLWLKKYIIYILHIYTDFTKTILTRSCQNISISQLLFLILLFQKRQPTLQTLRRPLPRSKGLKWWFLTHDSKIYKALHLWALFKHTIWNIAAVSNQPVV